jgi:hypothetical protein
MKRSFYLLIFAAALRGQVPTDSVIREILADRIDAQFTFETGADGRATAATLHQNGRDQKAKRVEP